MEVLRSRRRVVEMCPERPRRSLLNPPDEEAKTKTTTLMSTRVQIVYYLTRNGQLEHPHFMEVLIPPNQPLRLRDVMKRLIVLRGKGMPSLYSWSCKRSYRNGYVWNDLAEDDVIYPSDNTEYVLKGSELVQRCSEKFQELQPRVNGQASGQMQDAPNCRLLRSNPKPQYITARGVMNRTASFDDREISAGEPEKDEDGEEEEEYEMEEAKTSYTSSTTPQSICSRGVSTEELEFPNLQQRRNIVNKPPTKPVLSDSSESNRLDSTELQRPHGGDVSKRFEDGDPVESGVSQWGRGSVLLQLIACGNMAVAKAKNVKEQEDLRKEVLCRNIVVNKVAGEEDREMIRIMSENPRFGNSQAEEKEYFSGSIVETVSQERVTAEPVLRRSNSFTEERIKGMGTRDEANEEEKNDEERNVKGKCIPRRMSSCSIISSSKQIKK